MGEQIDSRVGLGRHRVTEVLRLQRRRGRLTALAFVVGASLLIAPIVWQQVDNRRFKPAVVYEVRQTTDDRVVRVWAGRCESGARLERLLEDDRRVVIYAESLRGANDCEAPRFDVELHRPIGDRLVIDGHGNDGAGSVIAVAEPGG